MGSPVGLFISLTQAQRDAYRAIALDAIFSGQRISLSGGAKSGTKQFQMSPQDALFELNYADKIASGVPIARQVVQILNNQYTPAANADLPLP